MEALDLFFALPIGSKIGFSIQLILGLAIVAVIIISPFRKRAER